MAITAPAWCSHAVPGPSGWQHPETGEVYKSARFTDQEIAEFFGHAAPAAPAPAPQTLTEAPAPERTLSTEEVQHHYAQEEMDVVVQATAPLHHSGEWAAAEEEVDGEGEDTSW